MQQDGMATITIKCKAELHTKHHMQQMMWCKEAPEPVAPQVAL
jgi:hypothetical protein